MHRLILHILAKELKKLDAEIAESSRALREKLSQEES